MAKIHFGILDGVSTREGKTKGKSARKKLKNGNIPIYLTISQNRKLARYRTSVEIPSATLWNPAVRRTCGRHSSYRSGRRRRKS